MDLKEGVNDIADGGSYDFGSHLLSSNADVTFTIENTGTADLNLTTLPITIGGADASQFSIQTSWASLHWLLHNAFAQNLTQQNSKMGY